MLTLNACLQCHAEVPVAGPQRSHRDGRHNTGQRAPERHHVHLPALGHQDGGHHLQHHRTGRTTGDLGRPGKLVVESHCNGSLTLFCVIREVAKLRRIQVCKVQFT